MSNIKAMFAKMANNSSRENDDEVGAGGDNREEQAPKPAKSKKGTIESTYQKKSQLEHILLRPDTYIGSVEKVKENMWVFDRDTEAMVEKQIEYVPGLYKIFDEILVNAADNKQRDKKMDCIKIEINQEGNQVSVWNNGHGIPVVMHKEENMYVPTMIFGHLLTSSNYNDEEEKVTGGRNGYGAKLCNIFSTKFVVETASKEYKKQYKQTWASNMTKASDPKISNFSGEEFTKITFCPDLAKFKMDQLDDDIVALMCRRAYDVAASTRGVKVYLNGKRVPVKSFKDYVELYVKGREDETGNNLKVIYDNSGDRWEVGVTTSEQGFRQMSFVNSIATTKGGRHVDYVVDMIVKQLIEILKKKNKGGVNIKPHQVKSHMWIFINCLIVNPTFDSQTKENMTLQMKNFGSKCTLSDKFITQVTKCGIVESVLTWAKFKEQSELKNQTKGKKQSKLKGIPKLEDANDAGGKNALKCTLILTEGDSAKSLAVSGLGVIGRDLYGVFPLRGKLLNVREATHKQILENAEINNLIKILGLQYHKKYNTVEDMKLLRYGKVMIMTDQDQDGSHIKGLLINFIHHNWPELLKMNFLEEFITPIVKAKKNKESICFYSLPELEEWRANTPNHNTYHIKYYKGLGTSTSEEAREYFSNMARHRITFKYQGQQDDDHIILAFSRKHIEHRKEWLTNFMVESKRRRELGLSEKYLYTKNTKQVTFTDFVNLELVLFSNADNVRSIPSVVDGFKPGQRKVLYTCFRRNDKGEIKVAQLVGSVMEMAAYHHGDAALSMTIVGLAQNFVGSNNINLLEPRGQFGTRNEGGKDAASPRYIFTKVSPLSRMIFHPSDDALLKYEFDDNQKVEPTWYIPIIPMVLVNGADGIGTGWMTKIPNFNPRQVVDNIRKMLDNEEPVTMHPFYKNFVGNIEDCGDHRFVCSGEIAIIGHDKVEITELPVGTWTQTYKQNVLEPLLHGDGTKIKAIIADYKEYHTDVTVKFAITFLPGEMQNVEQQGFHKVFKLQTMIQTGTMCAFDEYGGIKKYNTAVEVLQDFYSVRLKYYQLRKDFLEGMLEAEAERLSNQARFILEKCAGTITVENKKRKAICDELAKRGYTPDPVATWKERVKAAENEEEVAEEEEEAGEEESQTAGTKKPVKSEDPEAAFRNATEVKKYDYLLGMSMWMLTEEKRNELLRQKDKKLAEMDTLKKKTKESLWREDLDVFMEKLEVVEKKEREAAAGKKETKVTQGKKKKALLQEAMPSPAGKRIEPVIGEDLKKKIQTAAKTREKAKKGIKKESTTEEPDEFDDMLKTKSLKDKVGTPDDVEKKIKGKKGGDGLKQTKLNFKKKDAGPKANGTPRKKRNALSDSDDNISISDSDLELNSTPIQARERPAARRAAAAKPIKYDLLDDDEDEPLKSEEEILHDNTGIKSDHKIEKAVLDSESEEDRPPVRHETSEDLFDSLVGRSATDDNSDKPSSQPEQPKRKKIADSLTDSEAEEKPKKKKKTTKKTDTEKDKPKPKKKAAPVKNTFTSDSDSDAETKPKKKKATKPKKALVVDDSDSEKPKKKTPLPKDSFTSDSESEIPKKKKTATKSKGKKNNKDSDDSDFDLETMNGKKNGNDSDNEEEIVAPRGRAGRATKKSKYVFDDSDDLSD